MARTKKTKALKPELDDEALDDAIAKLLAQEPDGLEIKTVRASFPKSHQPTVSRLEARLKALVAAGTVHRWGKVVAAEPYAVRARARVLELLEEPTNGMSLQAGLPKTLRVRNGLKPVLERAIAEGVVFEHPDPKGKKVARYALVPADPKQHLGEIEKAITATLKKLARSGVDRDALLVALVGHAAPMAPPLAVPPIRPETLLDAVLEIRPDARAHVLVSVRDLRRHLAWSKSDFDRTVLALAREGRITLHHHDHPTGLSATERNDLVRDDRGNFYVGLVLEEAAA